MRRLKKFRLIGPEGWEAILVLSTMVFVLVLGVTLA